LLPHVKKLNDHATESETPVPTVAVDAMGGDFAPDEIVAGAVQGIKRAKGQVKVVLVGREDLIVPVLDSLGCCGQLDVIHAVETVEMDDSFSAVRRKKDSSLATAVALQRDGRADALVSAGNTGAAMGLSLMTLGRIEGVDRPAIACPLPTAGGPTTFLDVGANSRCKAEHLYQFAVMGSHYHADAYEVERPTVGLLSIGEEQSKGDEIVKEAHALMADSNLNFIGNVEGRDVLPHKADVVVTDGFTGNVMLKFAESIPGFIGGALRAQVKMSPIRMLGSLLMRGAFNGFKRTLDHQEYGGAPLLGINGVTIICHGRSQAKAIDNAIHLAARAARKNLRGRIRHELENR
jgi:phosphate acyltransferase